MQFAESWLRSFVNPDLSSEALAELLTMAGLEVEERRPAGAVFSGVCVAQVKTTAKHPNADRLTVCEVDVGDGVLKQIVCGAPNVAPGIKIPCALPGALLPGGFAIKPTVMRGVESGGMLCSAKELGVSQESTGLMVLPEDAPVGVSIRDYLALDDVVLVLKMTPNRADCLSVYGVAREVSALTHAALCSPDIKPVEPSLDERLEIGIADKDLCGRFSGRVIRGVNASVPTPPWMRQRLERAGQRSISALVDISNYVMLELGRPSHVFDLAKVCGPLTVRWAKANESLELLNGNTVELSADIGVIADVNGPLAMAGIMGGQGCAVSLETTDIYLESAFWWPDAIAGKARRYNFSTDASHRFERGVDFSSTALHLERITALIIEICGGQAGPVDDQTIALPARTAVSMRLARAEKIIGMPLQADQVKDILQRLGCDLSVAGQGADSVFTAVPPAYRFDLQIEEDLIEEVIRVIGYDRLPSRPPKADVVMQSVSETRRPLHAVRHAVAALGYQEVVNFGFVQADWEQDFAANTDPVRLLNPIASHLEVMRSTLMGSLVGNLKHNLSHRADRVRVFEVARVFKKDPSVLSGPMTVAGFDQPRKLAGLAYGSADQAQWGTTQRAVDFFDVKGDVESLLPVQARFEVASHPALHPGRSATVWVNGLNVGVIGQLHPKWVQKYELPMAPVLFELDFSVLQTLSMPAYEEVSKQPIVQRDLALVVKSEVSAQMVMDALQQGAVEQQQWVKSLFLFDEFKPKEEGKGLNLNEKSLAFRIVLQDSEKSIEEAQVELLMKKMIASAAAMCGAYLR
jgi:phenylalanyl-tRNA synthetase beta chain